MSRTLKEIIKEINDWQNEVFTQATPLSAVIHLQREVRELKFDIETDNPKSAEGEIADIFILLVGVAHKTGINIEEAVERKMAVNRLRTWGKPDREGVVEHVKEEEVPVYHMKLDKNGNSYGIGRTGE